MKSGTSATSFLRRRVGSPVRWIILSVVVIVALVILQVQETAFSPARLEAVRWTWDPDYQTFYGPGTPQSKAVVERMVRSGALGRDFTGFEGPVYVYPPVVTPVSRPEDPALIYPFTRGMAEHLRAMHRPTKSK